jgi:RNA polymerase sigma factor (sigma-70 family)
MSAETNAEYKYLHAGGDKAGDLGILESHTEVYEAGKINYALLKRIIIRKLLSYHMPIHIDEVADDLLNEVVAIFLQKNYTEKYKNPNYVTGALKKICNILVKKFIRERIAENERFVRLSGVNSYEFEIAPHLATLQTFDPELVTWYNEQTEIINKIIQTLTDKQKQVILESLSHPDVPYEQLAKNLGLNVGNFRLILHRAKMQVKKQYIELITSKPK